MVVCVNVSLFAILDISHPKNRAIMALLLLLRFTDSDYPFGIFKLFLQVEERKMQNTNARFRRRRNHQCLFVRFLWPLCCLFFDIRIRITPLVSSNSSSYITSQQYILTSLNGSTMYVSMSVFFVILDISHPRNMALLLLRFTDSDYPFGIFKRFLPFLTLCLNLSRPVRNDMH